MLNAKIKCLHYVQLAMESHHSFIKEVFCDHTCALSHTIHCLSVLDKEKILPFLLKNLVAGLQDDHPKSTPVHFRSSESLCNWVSMFWQNMEGVTACDFQCWVLVTLQFPPCLLRLPALGEAGCHTGKTLRKTHAQTIRRETNFQ